MAGENIKHKTGSNLPALPTSAQKLNGAASQQKTHDHFGEETGLRIQIRTHSSCWIRIQPYRCKNYT